MFSQLHTKVKSFVHVSVFAMFAIKLWQVKREPRALVLKKNKATKHCVQAGKAFLFSVFEKPCLW